MCNESYSWVADAHCISMQPLVYHRPHYSLLPYTQPTSHRVTSLLSSLCPVFRSQEQGLDVTFLFTSTDLCIVPCIDCMFGICLLFSTLITHVNFVSYLNFLYHDFCISPFLPPSIVCFSVSELQWLQQERRIQWKSGQPFPHLADPSKQLGKLLINTDFQTPPGPMDSECLRQSPGNLYV